MFHAGVVIVTNTDGKVLLLKRSDAVDTYSGCWNFPGGRPDENESPEDCAARECFEESSIKIDPKDLYFLDCIDHEGKGHIYFYVYENCDQDVIIDWESSDYIWAEPKQLLTLNIIPMPKELVEMIIMHIGPGFNEDKN